MSNDSELIEFAERLLALLDRGSFTATYKYAVLIGLMDLCVEQAGRGGGAPSSVTTRQLAEKVISLYWPQASSFADVGVLKQNNRGQAGIVRLLVSHRSMLGDASVPLARARHLDPGAWLRLVEGVEWILIEYPLPRLQVLGAHEERFIYQIGWSRDGARRSALGGSDFDNTIRFIGDSSENLVRLAGVLRPLLQREWAAMVARLNRLPQAKLEAFLFESKRQRPEALKCDLRDLQDDRCFYCGRRLESSPQVDHFIPWSRHPDDGVANLVIADRGCNGAKSDHLAASIHVRGWRERLERHADDLAAIAVKHQWEHAADRTEATARSIYTRLARTVPLWLLGRQFEPLGDLPWTDGSD